MSAERIIARLWSAVYDLLLYNKGQSGKTLDQIETELGAIEYLCRPYVDSDDIENSPFHLEEEYITMK